jgi:maltose-binding protein MalE
MRGLKRVVTLVTAIVITAAIALGCGKKVELTEDVTLTIWEQDIADVHKYFDKLSEEFQNANPKIKVKRVNYETEDLRNNFVSAAQAGKGPDLLIGPNDNLGVFVPAGLIVPAEEILGSGFFGDFDKTALEAAQYWGKQYMVPDRNGNELCLIYNKKLVSEAPKTFEEIIELSKKLKAEGKVKYGVVFNMVEPFFTIPFLGAFDGKVFDDLSKEKPQPTLDTDATKKWFAFMKKLQDEGVIPKEADYNVADNLFKEGKAAFIINGPWSFSGYKEAKAVEFGLTAIPTVGGKYPAPYSAVKGYSISKNVKGKANKEEAVRRFLAFMMSKKAQLSMAEGHKQLPVIMDALKDAAITENADMSAQKMQLEKCTPMPIITEMRGIWDAIKPVQQELFAGKIKAEDAPAKMQKKAIENIKALGVN